MVKDKQQAACKKRTFNFLFDLILYIVVNNLSVMLGQVFLGRTNTSKD